MVTSAISELVPRDLTRCGLVAAAVRTRGSLQMLKSVQSAAQSVLRRVRLYCFRLADCGTFMPLSGVCGISRIAVVWTRFVTAISAILSIHSSVLFTPAVLCLAVACE